MFYYSKCVHQKCAIPMFVMSFYAILSVHDIWTVVSEVIETSSTCLYRVWPVLAWAVSKWISWGHGWSSIDKSSWPAQGIVSDGWRHTGHFRSARIAICLLYQSIYLASLNISMDLLWRQENYTPKLKGRGDKALISFFDWYTYAKHQKGYMHIQFLSILSKLKGANSCPLYLCTQV